jgi:hypothetical protein
MERTAQRRAEFKKKIDALERAVVFLAKHHPANADTHHTFCDGIYIREFRAAAGSIITGVTHKTRHPFVLSTGIVDVCDEYGDVTRYFAPFTGITEPGTRRVFFVHQDIIWTTFHRTDLTDPDEWWRQNTEVENNTLPERFVPFGLVNRQEELT